MPKCQYELFLDETIFLQLKFYFLILIFIGDFFLQCFVGSDHFKFPFLGFSLFSKFLAVNTSIIV